MFSSNLFWKMALALTSKSQQESLKEYFIPHETLPDHPGQMGKKIVASRYALTAGSVTQKGGSQF